MADDHDRRARAVRGRHRHRGPLPAADRVEDVLRLLDGLRRTRRPTPTSARSASACRARCRSSTGAPWSTSSRPALAIERDGARRDPLGPQELLLPRPAQGLPDQPVRPAARVARPADLRHLGRPVHGRASPAPTSRRTRPSSSTRRRRRAARSASSTSTAPARRSWRSSPSPDIRTAEQARRYAEELQLLLRAIGASDADMERGQMRVEANVSLRPRGTEPFGTRVEVKNMNSFRSVERAIAFEIERQARGPRRRRAARPGDARLGRRARRDLPHAGQGDLRRLPLLPRAGPAAAARRCGLAGRDPRGAARAAGRAAGALPRRSSGCRPYDAAVLVADPDATALFEATLAAAPGARAKPVANWVTGEYLRLRNAADRSRSTRRRRPSSARPRRGASATARSRGPTAARSSRRTSATGETVGVDRRRARASARSPTPARSGAVVDEVLAANPAAVADYRAGKAQAIGFLVGQVMKATRGQANAALVQEAVRERLDDRTRTGRAERVGPLNIVLWLAGVALIAIGYTPGAGARGRATRPQGAGRQRRALRGVARRRPRRRHDRRVGGDGGAPPAGPGRRRRSRSSASCSCSSGS